MLKFGRLLGYGLIALAMIAPAGLGSTEDSGAEPGVITYKLSDQIHWTESPDGASASAILYGNPKKPGLYVILKKWHAYHYSQPHFHPNDRVVTVLSGTWWISMGNKFDPDVMIPMPEGSVITNYARQVHFDGAKEGAAILEIVGEGPATTEPAKDN